jgi:hypothetical protein
VKFKDRVLGDQDLLGKVSSKVAPHGEGVGGSPERHPP